MFTWLVASGGTHRLAAVYLVIAALAFILVGAMWAMDAQQGAAGQATLDLHISRYGS